MSKSPGRNDRCPCGSGKKYKHCCLNKPGDDRESARRRYRAMEGELIPKLAYYARDHFKLKDFDRALKGFAKGLFDGDIPEDDPDFSGMFMPWIGSLWTPPELSDPNVPYPRPTVAAAYLVENENKLSKDQVEFIEALILAPYSFYQVRWVERGRTLLLRDALLGSEVEVAEIAATENARPGDILFSRVLRLPAANIMTGVGLMPFPPESLSLILDLREGIFKLKMSREIPGELLLFLVEPLLRETYFTMRNNAENPAPPQLANTDGDPLMFCRTTFVLKADVEAVLPRLAPLCFEEKPEDLLAKAERDPVGAIRRLEFHWLKKGNRRMKAWNSTVMGTLVLEPGRITAETNSRKRAKRIRAEIEKRLGPDAAFLGLTLQSSESARKRLESIMAGKPPVPERDPQESPEVLEATSQMAAKHWECWFDEKIPALGGRTPREAAKIPEGRELLEALLYQYERNSEKGGSNLLRPDVPALRHKLGLE